MVAVDPKKRFDSVAEIIQDVESILDIMSRNNQRFIQKNEEEFSIYDVFVAGRKQEFVDNFSKDLASYVRLLNVLANELRADDKLVVLSELKSELLAKYPKGKAGAAVKAAFMAVEQPEELEKYESGRYSFASYFLARYFEKASSHQLAHEHLAKALSKENDSAIILEHLLLFEKISKKCTCHLPHDFANRITKLLQATTGLDEKAALYKILAEHFMDVGLKPEGLRFFEAYLILKPYDDTVRFKCAYEYDNLEQKSLALHHYLIYQQTQQKPDDSAQNNLGWLYELQGMDILSNKMYYAAFNNGSTLAGSNLASRLLDVGRVDEAQKILRNIIAEHPDGDYNERVDTILGNISTKKKKEDEKYDKLVKDGEIISDHNCESVAAMAKTSFSWTGFWEVDGRIVMEIKDTDGHGLGALQRSYEKKAMDITFDGNTAKIAKVDIGGTYNTAYTSGILYLVSNDEFKGYAQKSDQEYKEVNGTRIADIEAYDKERATGIESILGAYNSLKS